jgi:hypothetical protein
MTRPAITPKEVYHISRPSSLLNLISNKQFYYTIGQEEIQHIFRICDALWLHSGDPTAAHAELPSGKCADGFAYTARVLSYAPLCMMFGTMLMRKLQDFAESKDEDSINPWSWIDVKWVIGSDHAGATLSFATAAAMGAQHGITEKGSDNTQLWKRFTIQPEECVLQVEDLLDTTETLKAVREGIISGNQYPLANFAPVVLALIHCSDKDEFEGGPILYLAHFDIKTWEKKDCPLCEAGSKRVKPEQNWAELTRKS